MLRLWKYSVGNLAPSTGQLSHGSGLVDSETYFTQPTHTSANRVSTNMRACWAHSLEHEPRARYVVCVVSTSTESRDKHISYGKSNKVDPRGVAAISSDQVVNTRDHLTWPPIVDN